MWLFISLVTIPLTAQIRHYDFIGAGHSQEVQVTTSSSAPNTEGKNTIDGFAIQNDTQLKDASRFLAQCTFGADMATIRMVAAMGKEAWLKEQFRLPATLTTPELLIQGPLYGDLEELEGNGFHTVHNWNTAWSTNNLTAPDLLRQRIGFALSQLMVINNRTDFFNDVGVASSNYYDLLLNNAFGNYEKLLMDVTRSSSMGTFLSHLNNPKADPINNIHPDENYAREIMQLFSIGLWELNSNGTRKYDNNGQFIPTYTNAEIKEFAQVFTGLGDGSGDGIFGEVFFETDYKRSLVMLPMKMYDAYHDTSEKHLLNGVVLPAGQSGDKDLEQTIRHLSTHPNTAPFISKSLIKMLTTSNPSPAYVQRVASVFNPSIPNNMQTVLTAILLDPEARSCGPSTNARYGKLREPMVRYMNYAKAFSMTANPNGDYPYMFECLQPNTGQAPLQSPSVFNFFLPDYSPQGPINQQYMVAPEFQILNATNAVGLLNEVNKLTVNQQYLEEYCIEEAEEGEIFEPTPAEEFAESYELFSNYRMDYSEVLSLANDSDAFINYLDILLANGLLTAPTKAIIKQAISQLSEPMDKLRMATYLIMISPDYAILK